MEEKPDEIHCQYKTLDYVLEHYCHNIQLHPNLSEFLNEVNGSVQKNISNADKKAIIAFLNTLTDYNFITNSIFSDPFQVK
jgi:cytochrome c peroxidase